MTLNQLKSLASEYAETPSGKWLNDFEVKALNWFISRNK